MTLVTVHPQQLQEASRIVPISVHQYDRMIDEGILVEGSPIELIDGLLVLKDRSKSGEDVMTVGSEHIWAVKAIGRIDSRLWPLGYHIQTQAPVIVSEYGEPEPDGAILTGTADDYLKRKPTAADAACVIEVADSSLDYDRTTKLSRYAGAGIGQYIIVNLVDGVIENYTVPDATAGNYRTHVELDRVQTLELLLRDGIRLAIPAGDWLPPAP